MRTRVALVVLAAAAGALLLGRPGADAQPRVRCTSGQTMFVEGGLRMFALRYRTSDEWGYLVYACRGGRGRPLEVGGRGSSSGLASGDTPMYAIGGGRYLGGYHHSDGEGGPSAHFDVVDLVTRRGIGYVNVAFGDDLPPFRVASNGALILVDEERVKLHAPDDRDNHTRTLSSPGATVTDLALAGNTVYWSEVTTEGESAARAETLDGVAPDAPEERMLEPALLRRRGACPAARGATIAASPAVRIYQRRGRRRACRSGRRATVPAGVAGDPVPRIVADRWLLIESGRPATQVSVVDTRTGSTVTRVRADVRHATLLRDGTLAWLEDSGRLLLQRPGDAAPTELAAAAAGVTALAAGRRTVYWTAGRAPQQATSDFTPPPDPGR